MPIEFDFTKEKLDEIERVCELCKAFCDDENLSERQKIARIV